MDILCMKFCELVVAVESYESYENADCTEDSEPFLTFLVGEILKSSNLVSNCESGMTNSSLPSLFLSSPPSLPSLLIPVGLEQKLTIMVESKDSSLSFPQSDGGYIITLAKEDRSEGVISSRDANGALFCMLDVEESAEGNFVPYPCPAKCRGL